MIKKMKIKQSTGNNKNDWGEGGKTNLNRSIWCEGVQGGPASPVVDKSPQGLGFVAPHFSLSH